MEVKPPVDKAGGLDDGAIEGVGVSDGDVSQGDGDKIGCAGEAVSYGG